MFEKMAQEIILKLILSILSSFRAAKWFDLKPETLWSFQIAYGFEMFGLFFWFYLVFSPTIAIKDVIIMGIICIQFYKTLA
jgi:hypothetical protein